MNQKEKLKLIGNIFHVFDWCASFVIMVYSGILILFMLCLIFADFLGVVIDISKLIELRTTIIWLPIYFILGWVIQSITSPGVNQAILDIKKTLKKKRK